MTGGSFEIDSEMCIRDSFYILIVKQLLDYPNVKLFYYQNIEEIVTDLNNYKDYSHYSSDVNPVSYTHLDVYKRQVPMEANQSAPFKMICGTLAKVSTLFSVVGLPNRPLTAG